MSRILFFFVLFLFHQRQSHSGRENGKESLYFYSISGAGEVGDKKERRPATSNVTHEVDIQKGWGGETHTAYCSLKMSFCCTFLSSSSNIQTVWCPFLLPQSSCLVFAPSWCCRPTLFGVDPLLDANIFVPGSLSVLGSSHTQATHTERQKHTTALVSQQ